MQETDKKALRQSLIELMAERFPQQTRGQAQAQLSADIDKLIDDACKDAQDSEQKQVNILLSDLRGFTALSETCSPLDLIGLLNRYLMKMSEIILRHGGTIDKFMGDSIMALWGAMQGSPEDLENTIACAIEMQLAMNEINAVNTAMGLPELFMGIGINTGRVVAGSLGSALHSEYTVIGDEVNLASRIEAHSLRGQILMSENTYQLAADFIEVGAINEVLVKGKREAVKMYELRASDRPRRLEVPVREARKSPRVRVEMPLQYRRVSGKSVAGDLCEGVVVDLSYGGLLMTTPVPLEPMEEIRIGLALSIMSSATSELYARVLRVRELGEQFECQMEFTFIEESARRELKSYIDQIVETG